MIKTCRYFPLALGAISLICSACFFIPDAYAQSKPVPARGVYYTGKWNDWNLFQKRGHGDGASKVTAAYKQLFYDPDPEKRICFPFKSDMAYVKDIANNDIRSEGQSYGMMIAVQRNDKPMFDKLWRFAKAHMQHNVPPYGSYFAWQVRDNGNGTVTKLDKNSAPDGDIYFAAALLFASGRWGNGSGTLHYRKEANFILQGMLHREQQNKGQAGGITNMFNARNQVVFVPQNGANHFTDPSYHLPAFFEYFARYAGQDKVRWRAITRTSRDYLLPRTSGYSAAPNHNSATGLSPDYAQFDGTGVDPWKQNKDHFSYDAWRVSANIAVDYMWWGNNWAFHQQINTRTLNFFHSQGSTNGKQNYGSVYTLQGKEITSGHGGGLAAMNAVAAQTSRDKNSWLFVDELWRYPTPTGRYRYYDGCLYMLGLLQVTGNFRYWAPR